MTHVWMAPGLQACKYFVSDAQGKGEKMRFLPLHPGTNALIHDYLDAAGHGGDENGALFRPVKNNRSKTKTLDKALTPNGVYTLIQTYSAQLGFKIRPHALRATAATNALDHQAGPCQDNRMAREGGKSRLTG